MTNCLTRICRRRARPTADAAPVDPTRPGAPRIHDGVPIAHEGAPGFPGPAPVAEEGPR